MKKRTYIMPLTIVIVCEAETQLLGSSDPKMNPTIPTTNPPIKKDKDFDSWDDENAGW